MATQPPIGIHTGFTLPFKSRLPVTEQNLEWWLFRSFRQQANTFRFYFLRGLPHFQIGWLEEALYSRIHW